MQKNSILSFLKLYKPEFFGHFSYFASSVDHLFFEVSFWDLRAGEEPVCCSTADWSHGEPVFGAVWTNSKTHMEVLTNSCDSAGTYTVTKIHAELFCLFPIFVL